MVDIFDLIFLVAQIILIGLFYYQVKSNGRAATYLIYAMVFGILATLMSLVRDFMTIGLLDRGVLALQLILYGIAYVLIYLHFDGTISDSLSFYQTFALAFVFGIHSAYGIYFTFYGISDIPEMIWDVSYNILGLIVFYYVSKSPYMAFKHTREKSTMLQVVASAFIGVGFFASIFQTPIIAGLLGFEISGLFTGILKSVGILLIVIIFVINPDFIERLTHTMNLSKSTTNYELNAHKCSIFK